MTLSTKKKLLVLDVNGLLVERFFQADKRPEHRSPDGKVGKFYVYKRPFCNEFLVFCFEKFEVGIWSSAQQHNVQKLVDFVFGDLKSKLAFTWHQSDCTDTGLRTLENNMKPVFLKELYKLWSKLKPDLPWEEGDYGPFNTLLIDDTPYKAMRNPPHTAIFPHPYEVSNDSDDALGGALCKYLEGIAGATNVQDYVKHHPFGQLPISQESPQWHFYRDILFIRLPTVNQNSCSIVETNVNGVTNKTLASIAYKSGSTQSSSSQQCSVPSIEREDDVLAETSVTCMTDRNGTIATPLSQKQTILNGLEENGVAKATQPRKRKRKSARQTVLNQEHEAYNNNNISLVDKEATFGISQQSDLDGVSKGDILFETAVICTTEKNGAAVTTLDQKHVNLNGLEENDVAKVTDPGKKRKNCTIEAAFNQEHKAHNSSVVNNPRKKRRSSVMEAALNEEQEAHNRFVVDYPWKKRGSVMEAGLNQEQEAHNSFVVDNPRKKRRNSVMDAALNQEHEAHNRSVVDKEAVDSDNNTLKRSGRDFRDAGCSNRGHHKASHFNKDYRNCSNHRLSDSFHTNTGVSRTYHSPRRFEGNWRHQTNVNATLQTRVAQAGTYAQTNTGGSRTSRFPRKFEGNGRQHQPDACSTIQTQVSQVGTYAQSNTGGSGTYHFPRKCDRNWKHQNDANATFQMQVAQHGTHAQSNTGDSRTSYFPTMVEGNWRNKNDVNAAFQTQMAQAGTYAYNNAFGRSVVPENHFVYQGGGHTNGGQYQSWANQHSNFGGGFYGAHYENHNHFYNPQLPSHSYSMANHMRRKSNDRKTHRSNNRY